MSEPTPRLPLTPLERTVMDLWSAEMRQQSLVNLAHWLPGVPPSRCHEAFRTFELFPLVARAERAAKKARRNWREARYRLDEALYVLKHGPREDL